MAAVTPNHHGNGTITEKDPASETSPSRFTAVNGRESSASAVHGNGNGAERARTEDRERRDEVEDGQKSERLTVSTQRDDWAQYPTNGDGAHPYIPGGRHPQPPNTYSSSSANTSPHKRKRSDSEERNTSSATSYHSHSLPKSPEQRRLEHESERNPEMPESESLLQRPVHQRHNSPSHDNTRATQTKYTPFETESQEKSPPDKRWYGQETQSASQPYSTQRTDASDMHLAETLQRETSLYGHSQRGGGTDSPEDEDEHGTPQRYTEYGTSHTPLSGVEAERKRRKRVFSNRTKTGCMTCRRRKKKCDEQHPECEYPLNVPEAKC